MAKQIGQLEGSSCETNNVNWERGKAIREKRLGILTIFYFSVWQIIDNLFNSLLYF